MARRLPFGSEAGARVLRSPTALAATTQRIPSQSGSPRPAGSRFIVSPTYDCLFFIFSPLLALGLGIIIVLTHLSSVPVVILGHHGTPTGIFINSFIMAHLFIVFFRSNGNEQIFRLHPWRFTVVPIGLFFLMCASLWLAIAMSVLTIWWDVYHSSLQTFGLGRIYDARRGNDAAVGRRLDYLLNLLLYAGPILAGASLMLHTQHFEEFARVDSVFFATLGDRMDVNQPYLRWAILGLGVPFLLFYLVRYWTYWRRGYEISFQKVALLLSTGACSIYTWGFNSFGEAFFIMNFFHAFQYFALVWWSEKRSMRSLFRLDKVALGEGLTLVLFLVIGFGYGFWAEVFESEGLGVRDVDVAFNIVNVVALMHFWYDGFIWSVRKKQV
jgi:hypothetical protein